MFFIDIIFLAVILFIIFSLIILPFHFAFHSIINILTIPVQLWKIATNKKLRKNHALEHSTINVLEDQFGYILLSGYATDNGFYIQGKIHPKHLEQAAIIGLKRLQKGEKSLAIHARCGTSMLAANFVSAVVFILLLWQTGMINLLNIIIAIVLSQFIGPIVGNILQRFLTTSAKIKDIEIVGIEHNSPHVFSILGFGLTRTPTKFFVKTRHEAEVEVIKW